MDRHYYGNHILTIARHPSETDERMMVRLVAFALSADDALTFTRGLSTEDEPDLWQKDPTGDIALWIEVGQPDDRRLRRACGRARRVLCYNYGRAAAIWWQKNGHALEHLANLEVLALPTDATDAMSKLARRTMNLHCTVQDGEAWLTDHERTVHVGLTRRKSAGTR